MPSIIKVDQIQSDLGTVNVSSNLQFSSGFTMLSPTLTTPTTSGVMTLGAGIKFPATQVSSADANTLDDYEEGTWTPVTTGLTFLDAVYTKIGRVVTVYTFIENTSGGAVSIDNITGLPFSSSPTVFVGNVISGGGPYVPYTISSTVLRIRSTTNVTTTLANGGFIYVTVTYFTST